MYRSSDSHHYVIFGLVGLFLAYEAFRDLFHFEKDWNVDAWTQQLHQQQIKIILYCILTIILILRTVILHIRNNFNHVWMPTLLDEAYSAHAKKPYEPPERGQRLRPNMSEH